MRKLLNAELGRPTPDDYLRQPKRPLELVLDNIRSMQNVGSLFRTADAFAVARIHLCGITAAPSHREIHKTALGAERTVAWRAWPSTVECLDALRAEGYTVLAVEQVEGARPLDTWHPEPGERYALVLGNEVDGVSQAAVDAADGALEIPQVGTKHSLNVAVAGGIVLWTLFCRMQ